LARKEEPAQPGEKGQPVWRTVEGLAWAAVAAQVLTTLISVATSARNYWLAATAVGVGFTVLRALILVGIRERANWALWCGIGMAAVSLATIPVLVHAHVSGSFGVIEVTPMAAVMGWITVAINAALLVAACVALMGARGKW
jgi:hypothetical protein